MRWVCVIDWMDAAVATDRVSGHMGGEGNDYYWFDPADVADVYLAAQRRGDAPAVLGCEFSRRPNASTFRIWSPTPHGSAVTTTSETGQIAEARQLAATPHSNGAVLVEIALSEGDLEAAWAASDEFGPGHMWKPSCVRE